ncbi:MAG TPA: TIGR03619 family F420-dependent LLM class oxidoreductase [Steroidobacteraceae bacterium]|nr:TIGR03619 family F420-dependent LLM class oxidoreductase [Steroidobacteraceae bacterium]
MRFTLALGFSQYPDFQHIARAAEEAGWTSICMPDTFFFPRTTQSEYPYAETQRIRAFIEGSRFIEPIVCMSWMAAATTRLRFFPNVMKVPMRQPLVLAKALNSLAVISGERIALGAGLSPWKEDFSYNGADFSRRGKLMDECIAILRGAMSGEYFEYHGENFDFGPMKMSPVPKKPIPILIGGHSKPALARAARLGDGWVSANTDFATLAAMIRALNDLRREHGTLDRPDFEIHGMDVGAASAADFRRLRDIGVTDACLVPWGMDPTVGSAAQLDAIRRFGDEIIARLD